MGSKERFHLRWTDFEKNISEGFQGIREDSEFFDVTLVTCDGKHIEAHRLVLSACSSFFRSVLKNSPHQKPLIYLKGIQQKELELILNFMYFGETFVVERDLDLFLALAEELQVRGLTSTDGETGKNNMKKQSQTTRDDDEKPATSLMSIKRRKVDDTINDDDPISIKSETFEDQTENFPETDDEHLSYSPVGHDFSSDNDTSLELPVHNRGKGRKESVGTPVPFELIDNGTKFGKRFVMAGGYCYVFDKNSHNCDKSYLGCRFRRRVNACKGRAVLNWKRNELLPTASHTCNIIRHEEISEEISD